MPALNVRLLCLLSTLALLGAGQVSALYCLPPITPDPIRLADVASVTLKRTRANGITINTQNIYQNGLLRSVNRQDILTLPAIPGITKGRQNISTAAETLHYTPAGRLAQIDIVSEGSDGADHTQKQYEYDAQGQLVRVLYKAEPRSAWATLATCTFSAGTVTEHETEILGFKPRTTVYALDARGQVMSYSVTLRGDEQDTNVTTITRDERGAVTHTEQRVISTISPLDVTSTTYNGAGLPAQTVTNIYGDNSELEYTGTTTFEYVMDARGNWTSASEYSSSGGVRELQGTETRTITYTRP